MLLQIPKCFMRIVASCLSGSTNRFNYSPYAFIVTRLNTCTMYFNVILSSNVRSKKPCECIGMRKACPWCVFISETLWKHLLNMFDNSSAKTHKTHLGLLFTFSF